MKVRMFFQGSVTLDDISFIPTPEQATTDINCGILEFILFGNGKSELVCDYVSVKEENPGT